MFIRVEEVHGRGCPGYSLAQCAQARLLAVWGRGEGGPRGGSGNGRPMVSGAVGRGCEGHSLAQCTQVRLLTVWGRGKGGPRGSSGNGQPTASGQSAEDARDSAWLSALR